MALTNLLTDYIHKFRPMEGGEVGSSEDSSIIYESQRPRAEAAARLLLINPYHEET